MRREHNQNALGNRDTVPNHECTLLAIEVIGHMELLTDVDELTDPVAGRAQRSNSHCI